MPIELHGDCKQRLLDVLRTALPKIEAKNGMFIERKSGIGVAIGDMVLPQTGKLHGRLIEYVDEFPFAEFVLDVLGDELWKRDKYESERDTLTLCEIDGFEDAGTIATRLIDSFQTLPWTYQLSFRLPNQLSGLLRPTVNEIALSPDLKLVRATEEFASQFPLAAPNKKQQERMRGSVGLLALLSSEPPAYDLGSLFLQVNAEGFIGPYGGSSPTIRAEQFFRAFCGLGIALRLFKHSHKLPTGIPTVAKSYFYVHKRDENRNWAPDNRLDVQDTTDRGLGGLQMHDLEGRLETDEQKLSWAEGALNNIAAVFSAIQQQVARMSAAKSGISRRGLPRISFHSSGLHGDAGNGAVGPLPTALRAVTLPRFAGEDKAGERGAQNEQRRGGAGGFAEP